MRRVMWRYKNSRTAVEFQVGLQALKGKNAWITGVWDFGPDNRGNTENAEEYDF